MIIPSRPMNLLASADILRKKFAKKSLIFRMAQLDWVGYEWRGRANHSGIPLGWGGGCSGGQVGGWAGGRIMQGLNWRIF